MNGDQLLVNTHFWKDRAEELRAIATEHRPGPRREQLLRLADLDEALARRALAGMRPLDQGLRVEAPRPGFIVVDE